MTAKERWSHWHWTTRLSIAFGLIAALWLGVTAAYSGAASLFLPRQDYVADRNADQLRAALHDLRDSARQEDIYRSLRYLTCRTDRPRANCIQPPTRP